VAATALLVLNPKSNRGNDAAAADCLRAAGIDVIEQRSPFRDAVTDIICQHRARVDLVVVGGGDGSLNAAAAGLIETGLPLGILPLGTANDLARTLALPTDLHAACSVIASGKTKSIDLGYANDKPFFNVASLGLSVEIANALNRDVKRFWGRFAYLKTALSVIVTARRFAAEIRSPAESATVKSLQIAVGNGRYYGGGMSVATDAAIDDQRLDLYSLECRWWWRVLWLAPLVWLGRQAWGRDVRTLAATEFTIRTRRPMPVNADGEIVTETPVTFRVQPAAIRVFVP
jgi:diacylglycerol kinase (ATP)